MKCLIIIMLLLASCSPQFHINKAKKHTKKAIEKGAEMQISTDTNEIIIVSDSNYIKNDTVYIEIIKVIEKVITKEGEIRYITRQDKRREYRKEKTEDKRDYKIELKKVKNEGLEIKKDIKIARNRNILFILAILLTIIIYIFYEKKRFKN
jgi:hypothetical protein